MNNFRRIAVLVIIAELALAIICNVIIDGSANNKSENKYRVEIHRALLELEGGLDVSDLDMDKYPSVIAISEFDASAICNNEYRVEEIDGTLYRFEYYKKKDNTAKKAMNYAFVAIMLISLFLFVYINNKIIKPFNAMGNLTSELAKGNLAVPIKEQKSKYFGRFLWGMDMLRETLEDNKERELEYIRDKKTLILSLSHDIKTPLSAIDLYTKALGENLYDSEEKREQALAGIRKNTEEIKIYINEIVKASREDFLNLTVIEGEFYLSRLIGAISVYYNEKLDHQHTDFSVEKVEDCLIYGDLDRYIEVLQNIMENAIKYGDGKWIAIAFDEEEDRKLMTISNSGSSLKSEEIANIFDSFYRGSNSGNVKGSGLGLYICKSLLHKMDGEIFARVNGDSFELTLVMRKM